MSSDIASRSRRILVRTLLSLGLLASGITARPALAVLITVTDPGNPWRSAYGQPTTGPISQAALVELANAAGDYWEGLIHDPSTMNVQIGFDPLPATAEMRRSSNGAVVRVHPNRSYFADPTPFDNSEYSETLITFRDFGSGPMNTGFGFAGATGAAAVGTDLFTILLHEIGHALGFDFSLGVVISSDLPFAGTFIPLSGFSQGQVSPHLGLNESLMSPAGGLLNIPRQQRTLPSDADILSVATWGRFRDVTLNNLNPVAEPGTMALLLAGCTAVAAFRGRRKRTCTGA